MIDRQTYKDNFCIPKASKAPKMEEIEMGVQAKKKNTHKIIISAAAAFIVAMLLSNGITYAATGETWIGSLIRNAAFANGDEAQLIENENETAAVIDSDYDFSTYLRTENGRLLFSFDGLNKDITDQVSATDYFRYEKTLENGGRSVILVGGSCEETWGWIELVFDKDGNYITNRMFIPVPGDSAEAEEWHNLSMHGEGVPCGDPELDDKLNN